MNKKPKTKYPRAFFKVKMGTQIIQPRKGAGAKDSNPYNRKAKHKKTIAFEHFDPVVFLWYSFGWIS
ncbi:MAG: hypothetical protein NC238_17200 [Dehalobacter sp.]|nr:hypothetical protein [Dehalobacter sp.]